MTRQKHLKDRIRARMDKTGERYTVARRHVLAKATLSAASVLRVLDVPGHKRLEVDFGSPIREIIA